MGHFVSALFGPDYGTQATEFRGFYRPAPFTKRRNSASSFVSLAKSRAGVDSSGAAVLSKQPKSHASLRGHATS
jgi:hypothetical protein